MPMINGSKCQQQNLFIDLISLLNNFPARELKIPQILKKMWEKWKIRGRYFCWIDRKMKLIFFRNFSKKKTFPNFYWELNSLKPQEETEWFMMQQRECTFLFIKLLQFHISRFMIFRIGAIRFRRLELGMEI